MFSLHNACQDVMSAESIMELSPQHLVVHEAGSSVVGPPRASISQQLLRSEEGLVMLRAAEEPKHGLDGAQPMVSL
jgi:hypothetical protein